MLERLFQLKAHNTNVRTEILAGVTTFLAMAYILFVNPSILGATGMDKGAIFVATCLAAAIGSTVMGLIANYPIALAPGMGLNAFFTYTVVLHMGHTWQVALGAVFISAVMFFLLSIFRIREWIINSIPLPLRSAIAAGIGLFLALIALHNAEIVVSNPATMVGLGDLAKPAPVLAALGFALIVALEALKVRGADRHSGGDHRLHPDGLLAVWRRGLDATFAGPDLPATGHRRCAEHRSGQRDLLLPVR
jgi:AGZA family xanthine/uracil permease-like MFS transporter